MAKAKGAERYIQAKLRDTLRKLVNDDGQFVSKLVTMSGCRSLEAKKIWYEEEWDKPLRLQTIFDICKAMQINFLLKGFPFGADTLFIQELISSDGIYSIIAETLEFAKTKRNWTNENLSFETGLCIPTIRNTVNQVATKPDVSLHQLCLIAAALNVPVDIMFASPKPAINATEVPSS